MDTSEDLGDKAEAYLTTEERLGPDMEGLSSVRADQSTAGLQAGDEPFPQVCPSAWPVWACTFILLESLPTTTCSWHYEALDAQCLMMRHHAGRHAVKGSDAGAAAVLAHTYDRATLAPGSCTVCRHPPCIQHHAFLSHRSPNAASAGTNDATGDTWFRLGRGAGHGHDALTHPRDGPGCWAKRLRLCHTHSAR